MGRLVGRRIGAALFVAAVAVCVLWLGWFLSHKGLDWAAKAGEVASAAIAAIGFLVTPFGKIADWLRGPRPPTLEEIARARNALHSALNAAWREEGAGIYLDFPMQVRFARCQGSVAQSPPPDGALPGQGLAGDFGNIVDAFTRDPPFRRIVLGAPGAGKTVLVTELQRRLVAAPGPRDPLPVIVPAAAWRPDRHSILAWLAHRLSADYAFLTVGQARALVASGNVLPILDGLDEMPSALARRHCADERIRRLQAPRRHEPGGRVSRRRSCMWHRAERRGDRVGPADVSCGHPSLSGSGW